MRSIPDIAALQFGVFTAAQGISAGWTASAYDHACSVGWLNRVRHGVYAAPIEPSESAQLDRLARLRQHAAAVSLANRKVPVSHGAAAALLGLDVLEPPSRTCATVRRGYTGDIPGVHLHRARIPVAHLARLGRINVLGPHRTVLDIARESGVAHGLVAADSALRLGLTTPQRVGAALAMTRGWPGGRNATRVVELADGRAESALESLSRLRIAEAGLPLPELQVRITWANGAWIGRVDFYWDEFGVVGEADGMRKYRAGFARVTGEKLRHEELEDAGLIVVRWGWEVATDFAAARRRLETAFARGVRSDRPARQWRATPWYPAARVS